MIEKISRLNFNETVDWIKTHKSGVVYCCTLNELMMAEEDKEFEKKLSGGDLLTPDGMPLVWYLRWKTGKGERVYGPELLEKFLISNLKFINNSTPTPNPSRGEGNKIIFDKVCRHIFVGDEKNQLGIRNVEFGIIKKTKHIFVGDEKNRKYFLKYGDYVVMPMKTEFETKDYDDLTEAVERSKADIVWLGLGARKQVEVGYELKKRKVKKVIITVGAAFDFLSGNKRQCPKWIRDRGGEWLCRFIMEPRRLGERYYKVINYLVKKVKARK